MSYNFINLKWIQGIEVRKRAQQLSVEKKRIENYAVKQRNDEVQNKNENSNDRGNEEKKKQSEEE